MARRKKKMLNERVEKLSAYDFEGSFESIEKQFQSMRDENPQYESFSVDIEYEYDYGDTERNVVFVIYGQRPETAKDLKKAAAQQANMDAQAEAQRRAQYEKLKKEFG